MMHCCKLVCMSLLFVGKARAYRSHLEESALSHVRKHQSRIRISSWDKHTSLQYCNIVYSFCSSQLFVGRAQAFRATQRTQPLAMNANIRTGQKYSAEANTLPYNIATLCIHSVRHNYLQARFEPIGATQWTLPLAMNTNIRVG